MNAKSNATAARNPAEPEPRPAGVRSLVHRRERPQRKRLLTMRLDDDVLAWFRAPGRGYQTRMNAVLRAYMEHRLGDSG